MYEYRNTTTIRLPDRTIVTDPCYDSKLKCLAHINTLPGEYTCNCIYDLTDRNIKGLTGNQSVYQNVFPVLCCAF